MNYTEVESILPTEILDLEKLLSLGGRVVEEFSVEVQRRDLETDFLTKFAIPADKLSEFGGSVTTFTEGRWAHASIDIKDYEIPEEEVIE